MSIRKLFPERLVNRSRLALWTCAALGTLAPFAGAVPIASDTFQSYTPGTTVNGQNGGSGFTSAYVSDNPAAVNAATETLSYSSGTVSSVGGSQDLQVVPATTGTVSNAGGGVDNGTLGRTFAAQSGPVYFSLLLRGNVTSNNEFFQAGLSNATGGEPALSFGITGGTSTAAATFFLRVPGGNSTTSAVPFNPNQTYLLVGKASVSGANGANYDQIDLFVNPSSGTEPTTPTVTRTSSSGLTSLSTLNFRTARFATGNVYSVDNVTLGTTYANVVSAPEPASAGLIALAGTGLLARRRRRA